MEEGNWREVGAGRGKRAREMGGVRRVVGRLRKEGTSVRERGKGRWNE